MGTILRSPSVITASMVLAALLALPQASVDRAATAVTARVELASSSHKMAPQPPQLSDAEKQALEDEKAGRPVADKAALNSAKQKIKEGEKYSGDRNKQKRGKKR